MTTNNMQLTQFVCSLCCEPQQEKQPRNIDGDPICTECVETHIIEMFEKALRYEFNYPPKWGTKALDVDDFADVIMGLDADSNFVNRYKTREQEYTTNADKRLYCLHPIDPQYRPRVGESPGENQKLALTPRMKKMCKAAGIDPEDCGGFILKEEEPGRIVQCGSCKGKLCGHCGLLTQAQHECDGSNPFESREDLLEATAGVNAQQCPNCPTLVGLAEACNHMTCPRCSTNFCYVCGEEQDPHGDHWRNVCPRYGRPEENPIFDMQEEQEEDDEDEEIEEMTRGFLQLRYVFRHRLEESSMMHVDFAWLREVLRKMEEFRVTYARDDLMDMLTTEFLVDLFREYTPLARAGQFTSLASRDGKDYAAMSYLRMLQTHGIWAFSLANWLGSVVWDLEQRQMAEGEVGDLLLLVASDLSSVRRAFDAGLFDVRTNDATKGIQDWALENGYELDDEPVMMLERLYDDLLAQDVMRRRIRNPTEEHITEWNDRHEAIMNTVNSFDVDTAVESLGFLRGAYEKYLRNQPSWATAHDRE